MTWRACVAPTYRWVTNPGGCVYADRAPLPAILFPERGVYLGRGRNDEGIAMTVRRGRPRSEQARLAVLTAAGDLLLEGGLGAAHVEAIAARAGVSKATIYKWWPNRGAVVLDGFLERVRHSLVIPEGLGTVAALEFQIRELVALFADAAVASAIRAIASEAQSDPELARAVRERWLAPRRAVTAAVLSDGIANGDLRPDLDVELVMDQLYGPLYFRLLFGHAPLLDDLAPRLVRQLLDGVSHPDWRPAIPSRSVQ